MPDRCGREGEDPKKAAPLHTVVRTGPKRGRGRIAHVDGDGGDDDGVEREGGAEVGMALSYDDAAARD